VTEYDERGQAPRPRLLVRRRFLEGFEYPVRGTPCETAIQGGCLHIPTVFVRALPDRHGPPFDKVVSYLGSPSSTPTGAVLGHLDRGHEAHAEQKHLLTLFEIFANAHGRDARSGSRRAARAQEKLAASSTADGRDRRVDRDLCVTLLNAAQ